MESAQIQESMWVREIFYENFYFVSSIYSQRPAFSEVKELLALIHDNDLALHFKRKVLEAGLIKSRDELEQLTRLCEFTSWAQVEDLLRMHDEFVGQFPSPTAAKRGPLEKMASFCERYLVPFLVEMPKQRK